MLRLPKCFNHSHPGLRPLKQLWLGKRCCFRAFHQASPVAPLFRPTHLWFQFSTLNDPATEPNTEQGPPRSDPSKDAFHEGIKSLLVNNHPEALASFQQSAQTGFPPASLMLACIDFGLFGAQPNNPGHNYLQKVRSTFDFFESEAKNSPTPEAHYHLGCYYFLAGTAEGQTKAIEQWSLASNYPLAQYSLAVAYEAGKGVEPDTEKAFTYYKRASEQGVSQAYQPLGALYEAKGDTHATFKFYEMSAERGFVQAEWDLARCYEQGIGVQVDHQTAFEYYLKVAERGYAQGQYSVACCYDKGQGVAQSHKIAAKYLEEAADKCHVRAMFMLGTYYFNGTGVEQDDAEAVRYFELTATEGLPEAYHYQGLCRSLGRGYLGGPDEKSAQDLFQLAKEAKEAPVFCRWSWVMDPEDMERFKTEKLRSRQKKPWYGIH